MSNRVRVGLVGLGIGHAHLAAYHSLSEQFEVLAVADLDPARARQAAEEFGIPAVHPTLDSLLQRDDIEVVDLCTPPSLHRDHILMTLAAGKHVVCEKPLVGSLREVDEISAAQGATNYLVMPIFQYRFGHGIQKLKRLVDQGIAGRAYLTTVETAWRRRADYYSVPWRGQWATELGGVLLTHAIHAHDLLTYILGPVKSVFARLTTQVNPIEVEDTAAVAVEMADGSLATLAATLGSTVEISRHRFCFSGLTAESNTRSYSNSGDPWTFTGDTLEIDAQIQAALADYIPLPEGFAGQFYHLYYSLRLGAPLPVTVTDARASLELVTALYASAAGGQPVTLPLPANHPLYDGWLPN